MLKKGIVLLLCLAMLAFAGCQTQQGLEVVQLHEVTHSVFYAPLYAAMELGYFEEEGLEIVLTNAGGSDKAMTAVLSGDADIGLMGPETTVYVAGEEGRSDPVMLIAQLTQKDGSFIVGRQAEPEFTWESLRGKSILGGRKGGAPCMTLMHVLHKNGVEPGRDVEVLTHIAFNMMGEAFASGEGDYTTLFEPAATQAQNEGYGVILGAVGEYTDEVAYTGFVSAQSTLQKKGDMVEKFLRALYRGQQFVRDSSPEQVAAAMQNQFPDSSLEVLTAVAANYKAIGAFTETPVVSEQAILNLMEIMEYAGELEKRPELSAFIDNSYALKVVK